MEKICEAIRNGETDRKAAQIGGITYETFRTWNNEKPAFSSAIKQARDDYAEWEMHGILTDAKKSLKTLILGREYDEVKTIYEPGKDGAPRIKSQTKTNKVIPPNATAIIFALCNRDPERWQNRVTNDINGKITTDAKADVSLQNVPDELLAKVIDAINSK